MELERSPVIEDLTGDAWKTQEGIDTEVSAVIDGEPRFLRISQRPDGSSSVIRDYTGKCIAMGLCEKVTEPKVTEACQGIFTSEEFQEFADLEEMTEEMKDFLMGQLTEIFLEYFA